MDRLLIRAVEWAERQASLILRDGRPLGAGDIDLARSAGVAHPEHIRILQVAHVPLPDDPGLLRAATEAGLSMRDLAGLVLGYGIFLRHDRCTPRVLSHEFRHVHQYEQMGSLTAFLAEYLRQLMLYGYAKVPFEIDARKYEIAVERTGR